MLKARRGTPPGVLGVLLVSFFLSGASREDEPLREKALALVDQGAAACENGDYGEALKLFFAAAENLPGSPGVYYNLGQTQAALGGAADSVFWLRMAAFANPQAAFIRARLFETENDFGVTHAASVPGVHPDIFFAFFAASAALACLLPWLLGRQKSGARRRLLFVCLTALFLAAAFSAAATAYQAASRGREWGVVDSGGTPLRKIPRNDSSEWLRLAEGTAVDIVSRSGGFALVSTGSGIKGWIEEKSLLENTREAMYGKR
jgi:tetratricopeptide (TPR) repeat protein